jgi:beta-galactosidase GanA
MQNFIKHYLNGLTEIVKNYIYPRGPLYLMELDVASYFGGNPFPWKSDYNPHIVETLYPRFLEQTYGDIKDLKSAYNEKADQFEQVPPPRDFIVSKDVSFTKIMDWFRFKEQLVREHAINMIDLYKSFSCEPLFNQPLAFHKRFMAPMTPIVESDGEVFPTIELSWDTSSTVNLQKVRYLRANSQFPWGSSISAGHHTTDHKTSKQHFPISA